MLIGILFATGLATNAAATEPISTVVRDFSCSIYTAKGLSPELVMHARGIYSDYERRGFFRIGLMPLLVVDQVRIEVQSVDGLTNVLSALRTWGKPGAGAQRLKLRRLEINLGGEKQPWVRAADGQVGSDGAIQLTSVLLDDGAGHPIYLPAAELQLTGPARGRLRWMVNGQRHDLFAVNTST